MIRRLIILLLIVGCAPTKPTTATFYIGMAEEEFTKEAQDNSAKNTPKSISNFVISKLSLNISYLKSNKLNRYF